MRIKKSGSKIIYAKSPGKKGRYGAQRRANDRGCQKVKSVTFSRQRNFYSRLIDAPIKGAHCHCCRWRRDVTLVLLLLQLYQMRWRNAKRSFKSSKRSFGTHELESTCCWQLSLRKRKWSCQIAFCSRFFTNTREETIPTNPHFMLESSLSTRSSSFAFRLRESSFAFRLPARQEGAVGLVIIYSVNNLQYIP